MALTVGTDTYISLADAAAYVQAYRLASPWDTATEVQHEAALRTAFRRIERQGFRGYKVDQSQACEWPRYLVSIWPNVVETACPDDVKHAQVEEALAILEGDMRHDLRRKGVRWASAGSSAETFAAPGQNELWSHEARGLLTKWVAGVAVV